MTIVLGFSGGSVAPILWGHFQAIKSFICVDLKESCEVPSGWNPLQWVTTVSMGFTLTGGHQYCPHVLMKQHQRRCCKSSESPLKGALQAEAGGGVGTKKEGWYSGRDMPKKGDDRLQRTREEKKEREGTFLGLNENDEHSILSS